MKLVSVSESIKLSGINKDFQTFVNEAGPRSYKPTNEKIKKCIKNRNYAGIYYEEEGDDEEVQVLSGFRLIEPVCFGKGYKSADGHTTHVNDYYLRAFVIKESTKDRNKRIHRIHRKSVSKSNRVPYWRMFRLDRITMFETIRFKIPLAREGYNPNDAMIAEILASIEF